MYRCAHAQLHRARPRIGSVPLHRPFSSLRAQPTTLPPLAILPHSHLLPTTLQSLTRTQHHIHPRSGRSYASLDASAATQQSIAPSFQSTTSSVPRRQPPPFSPTLLNCVNGIQDILINDIGGSGEWAERTAHIKSDLTAGRRGRLAVIGDVLSGPRDLVSAFLQDPLLDDKSTRENLLERYTGSSNDVITLTHGVETSRTDKHLQLPSSWLQASGYDVVEIQLNDHEANASEIMACDAVLVVLDPIRLLLVPSINRLLPFIKSRNCVRIAVNGPLPSSMSEAKITNSLKSVFEECPTTFFVESDRALQSLRALSQALSHSSVRQADAFDQFQKSFLESRLGPMQTALAQSLPEQPQLATTSNNLQLVLQYVSSVLESDREVLRSTTGVIGELRRQASLASGQKRNASVITRGVDGAMVEGSVQHSLNTSQLHLRRVFTSRLSWLSLLARLRVDDVGAELGSYFSVAFGRKLEEHLVYEAGQLYELQSELSKAADATVRKLASRSPDSPGHPFSSQLLLNHLRSLSVSIPPVTPKILLAPFVNRRTQMIEVVVPRIQRSAQKTILSTCAFMIAGVSASWILAMISAISGLTAAGLATLTIVSGLYIGQSLWARAQKRFWKDWDRVMNLMRDDLSAQYQSVIETMVVAKPSVAANGLDELVAKRQNRLEALQKRLETLRLCIEQ